MCSQVSTLPFLVVSKSPRKSTSSFPTLPTVRLGGLDAQSCERSFKIRNDFISVGYGSTGLVMASCRFVSEPGKKGDPIRYTQSAMEKMLKILPKE